jgi:hypothetical protein
MRRSTKFRPSVAMIIACLALFIALGGVGYAATKIHGKNVIDRTLSGKKLKKNAVGGTAIKESALGTVPNAGHANSADSAASAQSATSAQSAANADQLDGIDSSGYMSTTPRLFEERVTSEVSDFGSGSLVAALSNVPAGAYLVTARLEYDNDGASENETCTLGVPGANDAVTLNLAAHGSGGEQDLASLQKVVSSGSDFTATVSCTGDGDDDLDQISIIALRLD